MTVTTPAQALEKILSGEKEGRAVETLQIELYHRFGLKLSYHEIEATLAMSPGMFSQVEGLWKLRTEG
jgi:hypothetical protein